MSLLTVPGAQVYYEVEGSGPLLILIPGASGTGESFRPLISHLTAHYQVVIYDRRGFSQSKLGGPQDYAHRLATDADDVRRLIERVTDQPAMVFGNSSGALVALEVLIRFPERVQTVIVHEPPIVSLLPDAGEWLAFFDKVYETSRKQGVPAAMHQFASRVLGSLDHQILERLPRSDDISAKQDPGTTVGMRYHRFPRRAPRFPVFPRRVCPSSRERAQQ